MNYSLEEIDKCLRRVLTNTFKNLQSVYSCNEVGNDVQLFIADKIRICEQDLRFTFIETFLKTPEFSSFSYSVEVPTKNKYNFKGEDPCLDEQGKRGNIDLVIYKDGSPVVYIEFKSNNPIKKNYTKDLLKLKYETTDKILGYLICVYRNSGDATIDNIRKKLGEDLGTQTHYIGYSLNHNKSNGCIFEFDNKSNSIVRTTFF